MAGVCAVCQKPDSKVCSRCRNAFYCSPEHQKVDWKTHKVSCTKLYTVKQNDVLGRHLVASRDIPAGTILLKENALMISPDDTSLPMCLGCHQELKWTYCTCSKCGLPVCNKECELVGFEILIMSLLTFVLIN